MSNLNSISLTGGVHKCFSFYLRLKECISNEEEYILMCRDSFEDYMECWHRYRARRLNFRAQQEMQKWKVLAIPRYNELIDAFEPVELPADPDVFFK